MTTTAVHALHVVGAKVAVFNNHGEFARMDRIRKVYKNGNVVLEGYKARHDPNMTLGDKVQYSLYANGERARETGQGWRRGFIRIYNDALKEEIDRQVAEVRFKNLRRSVVNSVEKMKSDLSEDQCNRILAILEEE